MSSTEDEDSSGKLTMLCLHGFLQSATVSVALVVTCGQQHTPLWHSCRAGCCQAHNTYSCF